MRDRLAGLAARARGGVSVARTLAAAGVLRPSRPDQLAGAGLALATWGINAAGGYAAMAARDPRRLAVVSPDGTHTFAEVDRRTSGLAAGLRASGIRPGDRVGVLAGNDFSFVEAVVAVAKTGADTVLLNTGLAAPVLAAVAASERLVAVVQGDGFAGAGPAGVRAIGPDDRAALSARHAGEVPNAPGRHSHAVLLTSGTTGPPKGAPRAIPPSLEPVAGLLAAMPLRAGETTVVAAPLFHAWGYSQWLVSLVLGSTMVLTGKFDAELTLAAVAEHRATALVAVPLMLRRLLDLPAGVRACYDTSSLRVVAVSGSALPAALARDFMAAYGDVLYNLYGSTEVAWATVAGPADLRRAPGTAGRPVGGSVVRLLGADGQEVPPGVLGEVYAGSALAFGGYTGGGGRPERDGLLSTGDLGRWDSQGLLHVAGRADDMVVSGGENVFPEPVEECLRELPGVADVAVAGVPDDEWGQRLCAYVVPVSGFALDAETVRAHVRDRLARHAVPRDVVFVETLPRNAAGKLLRRELGTR